MSSIIPADQLAAYAADAGDVFERVNDALVVMSVGHAPHTSVVVPSAHARATVVALEGAGYVAFSLDADEEMERRHGDVGAVLVASAGMSGKAVVFIVNPDAVR